MADPWRSAIQGFNSGYEGAVALGLRKKEREEDMAFNREGRDIQKDQWQKDYDKNIKQFGIQEAAAKRTDEEWRARQLSQRAKTAISTADAMSDAGDMFSAIKTVSDFFNNEIPNGNKVLIMNKSLDVRPDKEQFWSKFSPAS